MAAHAGRIRAAPTVHGQLLIGPRHVSIGIDFDGTSEAGLPEHLDDRKVVRIGVEVVVPKVVGVGEDVFHDQTLIPFPFVGPVVTANLHLVEAFTAVRRRKDDVRSNQLLAVEKAMATN